MPPQQGDRVGAGLLPGLDMDIGDATANLADLGAGIGGQGPGRAQIFHRNIDGARLAGQALLDRDLRQGRHLHKGAQNPAMDRGKHRVADKVRGKGQDGGHLIARQLGPDAQITGIGNAAKQGVQLIGGVVAHGLAPAGEVGSGGGTAPLRPESELIMKAAWAVASGSALSLSQALARTKAMERVTL